MDSTTLFAALKDVVVVAAVYSYFSGWVYASYYYQTFGLSLHAADIPLQYFFVYAFPGICSLWGLLTIFAAIGGLFLLAMHYPHQLAYTILLLTLFPLLYFVAQANGAEHARQKRFANDNSRVILSLVKF